MHALACLVLVGTSLVSALLAWRGPRLVRTAVEVAPAWSPVRFAPSTRVILTAPKTSPPV